MTKSIQVLTGWYNVLEPLLSMQLSFAKKSIVDQLACAVRIMYEYKIPKRIRSQIGRILGFFVLSSLLM
jgi:hypothetical protein